MAIPTVSESGIRDRPYSGLGFKNRIINGDFRICQRGTNFTSNADNSYTLDRWRLMFDLGGAGGSAMNQVGTNNVLPDMSNYCGQPYTGSSANSKFGTLQMIETANMADLRGGVCSLSFKLFASAGLSDIRAGVAYYTGTEDVISADPIATWNAQGTIPSLSGWGFCNTPANLGATTSFKVFKLENIAVPSTAKNLFVMIWNEDTTTTGVGGDSFAVTDVQLEAGPVCTPFERRPKGIEKMLCQRYWEQSYDEGTAAGSVTTNGCWQTTCDGSSTNQIPGPSFKVSKRITNPTMAIYSPAGTPGRAGNTSSSDAGPTSTTIGSNGENGMRAWVAAAGAYTANTSYLWHFTANAEL